MTERTVIKNADGGRFVSDEYAAAHPDTTYTMPVAERDRLDVASAAYTALTDSRFSWTLTAVPGIELTGTDVREMADEALLRVKTAMGVES